jgi:hypothetical protein
MIKNDDDPSLQDVLTEQPKVKPSNETTFHVSGKGLECHKVARMFGAMGMECHVVQNTTVKCDKDYVCWAETGCKVKIHEFPGNCDHHSLCTVWATMKKEFGLGCAHIKIRSPDGHVIFSGCTHGLGC